MNCNNCGNPIEPGAKFCRVCGTPVNDPGTVQTPNTPAPAVTPVTPVAPVTPEAAVTPVETAPVSQVEAPVVEQPVAPVAEQSVSQIETPVAAPETPAVVETPAPVAAEPQVQPPVEKKKGNNVAFIIIVILLVIIIGLLVFFMINNKKNNEKVVNNNTTVTTTQAVTELTTQPTTQATPVSTTGGESINIDGIKLLVPAGYKVYGVAGDDQYIMDTANRKAIFNMAAVTDTLESLVAVEEELKTTINARGSVYQGMEKRVSSNGISVLIIKYTYEGESYAHYLLGLTNGALEFTLVNYNAIGFEAYDKDIAYMVSASVTPTTTHTFAANSNTMKNIESNKKFTFTE